MLKIKRSTPPPWRFLLTHPAHFIACGLGSGLSPVAPGTAGTFFAWITYPFLRAALSDTVLLVFLAAAFIGGAYAAHRTGRDLDIVDHGSIVWDEIVPFWLVLFFCPPGWAWQTAAFLLFRFFDIVKPQPARYFDEKMKNGLGVMCDDLVAGAYSILVLWLSRNLLMT